VAPLQGGASGIFLRVVGRDSHLLRNVIDLVGTDSFSALVGIDHPFDSLIRIEGGLLLRGRR
jgi:hypothetical protein